MNSKKDTLISNDKLKKLPTMAFFHDNRFLTSGDGRYFSATGFTDSLFSKYLRSFVTAIVVARKNDLSLSAQTNKYDHISNKKVKFECIDRLSVFRLFLGKDRSHISKVVSECDISVIRLPSMIGIVAAVEARKQHKPYIIELVACRFDSLWNYGKLVYKLVAPILYTIDRLIVARAPYVVYVSLNFLQHRYPTKGRMLACSDAELSSDNGELLDDRLRKIESYRDAHTFRFGTVAAVDMKYKGQQYVLRALANLTSKGYDIEYYLVGSGSSMYLQRLADSLGISDRVHFVGPLPHNEIKAFMKKLDVYIQPSNAESHGRVILEAFETACPVIGSSTGGIPELIDQRFVFKRKDVSDLLRKIERILTKTVLKEQAKRNYKELDKYNPEVLDKLRSDFYETVASEAVDAR